MRAIKAKVLYDGTSSKRDVYISFDDTIKNVSENKPDCEIVSEGFVTPAFIDGHSHIGMVRAGEPAAEDESNEQMDSIYPLVSALDSVYMDDHAFGESIENGVLYSVVLPGSGNPIGGKAVLIRNYASNIDQAYMQDIGIKAALGYNPRSTTEWKGKRPTTRMGAVALLRENFIKARKTANLIASGKKIPDEIEPIVDVFMNILQGKYRLMVHLHKEDDAFTLMKLRDEFGFNAVLNHGIDIHHEEVFRKVSAAGIPLVYGPLDTHPYKVELKHESWRNAEKVLNSGIKFCMMSDHPVILQRNLFYTMRHFMRFGLGREEVIAKLTSQPAEILGIKSLGRVEAGYTASFSVWNDDPFLLSSHPKMVIAEGKSVYED
ncbi:dihydroorotase [Thermoplasmatales archaeon]|nr:dihydroorotase [Thermoplasmatales archaeon]